MGQFPRDPIVHGLQSCSGCRGRHLLNGPTSTSHHVLYRISPRSTPPSGSGKVEDQGTIHLQTVFHHFFSFSETIAALQAFRKRHADAQRIHAQLSSQPATVDLPHYRSILKNKAIVDDAEKLLKEFKPVTYDVNPHLKAIETFEAKAVGVLLL